MAVWPSSIAQVVVPGTYQETPPNNLLRTQMDAGPPKVRRRYTAGVRPISFSIPVTKTDTETLDVFYVTTLKDGEQPFDWTHPRTGVATTFKFRREPTYTDFGAIFYARLDLEILP